MYFWKPWMLKRVTIVFDVWGGLPLRGIHYYLLIFSINRSGKKANRGIEFRHKTGNANKIRRKLRSVES